MIMLLVVQFPKVRHFSFGDSYILGPTGSEQVMKV